MCVNDWRLGRLIRSSFSASYPTGNPALIGIKPSQDRVGIMFSGDDSGAPFFIYVWKGGVPVRLATISYVAGPLLLTLATHGDLPTMGFSLEDSTLGGHPMYVTEFWLPESALSVPSEGLKTGYP